MKILFIGSRLYDDIDYYVRENGIESIITESNEEAINLDLPDQVFIVPRGMDSPKQIAISQNVDAVVPLIGIDPPLIEVAKMKEDLEAETGIPVIAANLRAVSLTSDKIETKKFYTEISNGGYAHVWPRCGDTSGFDSTSLWKRIQPQRIP